MVDKKTQPHLVVLPPARWERRMVKILGGEFTGARELICRNGQILCAALHREGFCLVLHGNMNDPLGEFTRSKPYRQILGLTLADGKPLYVAWPEEGNNWPRVVWGEDEGRPHEAIDHVHLLWADGQPLYIALRGSQTFVVHGAWESKPCDQVEGNLLFVAGRPLYRGRRGREMFLAFGQTESELCDDISPPYLEERKEGEKVVKQILADATRSLQLCRLTFKVAA